MFKVSYSNDPVPFCQSLFSGYSVIPQLSRFLLQTRFTSLVLGSNETENWNKQIVLIPQIVSHTSTHPVCPLLIARHFDPFGQIAL